MQVYDHLDLSMTNNFFYNIDAAKQRDMIKKTFFEHVLFHWTVNVQ